MTRPGSRANRVRRISASYREVASWLRARPMVTDTFLAVLVGVLALLSLRDPSFLSEGVPTAVGAVWLLLGSVVPLVWRRTRPVAVMVPVALGCLVQLGVSDRIGAHNLALLLVIRVLGEHAGPV